MGCLPTGARRPKWRVEHSHSLSHRGWSDLRPLGAMLSNAATAAMNASPTTPPQPALSEVPEPCACECWRPRASRSCAAGARYFHVVFTLPALLLRALPNKAVVYDRAHLRTAADTLRTWRPSPSSRSAVAYLPCSTPGARTYQPTSRATACARRGLSPAAQNGVLCHE